MVVENRKCGIIIEVWSLLGCGSVVFKEFIIIDLVNKY